MYDRRSLASGSLEPRAGTNTVLWCAPGSSTYVVLTPVYSIGGNAIVQMIEAASTYVYSYISNMGDGPISGGNFGWVGEGGLVLNAWSANNHQTTYGVLGAAIGAISNYFDQNGYGRATFTIFDGENEVGEGFVG